MARIIAAAERAEIIEAFRRAPSVSRIARERGMPVSTVSQIISLAKARGILPDPYLPSVSNNKDRKRNRPGRKTIENLRNDTNRP